MKPAGARRLIVALGAGLAMAGGTRAQVMEIQPDGSTVTYSGPTQFIGDSARPIAPPSPARIAPAAGGSAGPSPETALAIRDASARHGVSETLVAAVAWRESGFNPAAVSPKGARGVMQLMPATARTLGVDPADPAANIDGGADYLSRMLRRFDGDLAKSLAAYNAGPEAVERYGGVPPYAETTNYVRSVLARITALGGTGGTPPR
jgi:soluble lytic murein transglycosylase-like protein